MNWAGLGNDVLDIVLVNESSEKRFQIPVQEIWREVSGGVGSTAAGRYSFFFLESIIRILVLYLLLST